MTIQHNLQAMNANRQFNITGRVLAKSARNLSSGYRINIAADDAAGLSISEKMRKQIRGLTQGVQNAEDGVSLCQVADGALAEVHDMLQRINELAIKAANGTNSESDRKYINDEVAQLLTEIDRIGDTTKFNEVYIFKGAEKMARIQYGKHTVNGGNTVLGPQAPTVPGVITGTETVPVPDFSNISMDCELLQSPFTGAGGSTGNYLQLAARSTKKDIQKTWNLIYGSGSTSSPRLVGSYEKQITANGTTSTTTCRFAIDLRSVTPTSISQGKYSDPANPDTSNKEWSRTFTYKQDDVDMEIIQTVTLHPKTGEESQYYTLNYEVKNKSGVQVKYNLVHHEDTAYNNNDLDEAYYIRDNGASKRLATTVMCTENTNYSSQFGGNNHVTTSLPSDFTIILNQNGQPSALSFTENIQLDGGDGAKKADTLIMGQYSQIGELYDYTPTTMSGILGQSTNRLDIGFSLIWSDKTLASGVSEKYSFRQGIMNREKDKNIPKDTKPITSVPKNDIPKEEQLPVQEKVPIRLIKNYMGGTQQIWIQSGADALDGMVLETDAMNTSVLDIDRISTATESAADDAILRISDAIAMISKQRSRLGAYQNRLEHQIANENNIVENTAAAESRIRDTDMAAEMVRFSNCSILQQAGQSMLSQANQSRQGILSLLTA